MNLLMTVLFKLSAFLKFLIKEIMSEGNNRFVDVPIYKRRTFEGLLVHLNRLCDDIVLVVDINRVFD